MTLQKLMMAFAVVIAIAAAFAVATSDDSSAYGGDDGKTVVVFDYNDEYFDVTIGDEPAYSVKILNFDEDLSFNVVKKENICFDQNTRSYYDAFAKYGIGIVVTDEKGEIVYSQTAENSDGTTEYVSEYTFTIPRQLGDRYGDSEIEVLGPDTRLKVSVVLSEVDVELKYVVTGSGQFYSTNVRVMSGPAVPFECYPEGEDFENIYEAISPESNDPANFYWLSEEGDTAYFNIDPSMSKLLAVINYQYRENLFYYTIPEGVSIDIIGEGVVPQTTYINEYGDEQINPGTFLGINGFTIQLEITNEEYEDVPLHLEVYNYMDPLYSQIGTDPVTFGTGECGPIIDIIVYFDLILGDDIDERIDIENSYLNPAGYYFVCYSVEDGYMIDRDSIVLKDAEGDMYDSEDVYFKEPGVMILDIWPEYGPITLESMGAKETEYYIDFVDTTDGLFIPKAYDSVDYNDYDMPVYSVKLKEGEKLDVVAALDLDALPMSDEEMEVFLGATCIAYIPDSWYVYDIDALVTAFKMQKYKEGATMFTIDPAGLNEPGAVTEIAVGVGLNVTYLDAEGNEIPVEDKYRYTPFSAGLPIELYLDSIGYPTPEFKTFVGWFDGEYIYPQGYLMEDPSDMIEPDLSMFNITLRAVYKNDYQTIVLLGGDDTAFVDVDPATGQLVGPMPEVRKAGMHAVGFWTYTPDIEGNPHGVLVLDADGNFVADVVSVGETELGVDSHVYVADGRWQAIVVKDSGSLRYLDVELYALFEGDDITVTLDNGLPDDYTPYAENEQIDVIMKGGENEAPENPFEREGFEFKGWTDEEGGELMYETGDLFELVEDMTLYAVWEPILFNVTAMSEYGDALFCKLIYYDGDYDQTDDGSLTWVSPEEYIDTAIGGSKYYFTVSPISGNEEMLETLEVGYFCNGVYYKLVDYIITKLDYVFTIEAVTGDIVLYVSDIAGQPSYTCDGMVFTNIDRGYMYITSEFYPDDVYVYNLATDNINPANAIVLMKIITLSGFDENGDAITVEELRYESMQFMTEDKSWNEDKVGQNTGLVSTAAVKIPAGDDLISVDIDIYMPLADGTIDHFASTTVDMTQLEVNIAYYERIVLNLVDTGYYGYNLMDEPSEQTVVINTFDTGMRFGEIFTDPEVPGYDLVGYYVAPEGDSFPTSIEEDYFYTAKRLTPYTAVSGSLSAVCVLEKVYHYLAIDLMGGTAEIFQNAIRVDGEFDEEAGTVTFEYWGPEDDPFDAPYILTVKTDKNRILLDDNGVVIYYDHQESTAKVKVDGVPGTSEAIIRVDTGEMDNISDFFIVIGDDTIADDVNDVDAFRPVTLWYPGDEPLAGPDGETGMETPEKEGMVFDGLYLGDVQVMTPDCRIVTDLELFEFDYEGGCYLWASPDDVVLEAHWTDQITVHFVDDDWTPVIDKVYTLNRYAEQVKTFPSKNGYTFEGYYTFHLEDDMVMYDDVIVLPNAEWVDSYIVATPTAEHDFDVFVYDESSELTLMAKWTPNEYAIYLYEEGWMIYPIEWPDQYMPIIGDPDYFVMDWGYEKIVASTSEGVARFYEEGMLIYESPYDGKEFTLDYYGIESMTYVVSRYSEFIGSILVVQDQPIDQFDDYLMNALDNIKEYHDDNLNEFVVGFFTKPTGGVMLFDDEGCPCPVKGISEYVGMTEADPDNGIEAEPIINFTAGRDVSAYIQFDDIVKIIFLDEDGEVIDIDHYKFKQDMTGVTAPVIVHVTP